MFARLGRAVALHPRPVVIVWLVLTVLGLAVPVSGLVGGTVFERVSTGTPSVPGSESDLGSQVLADAGTSGPSVTLLVQGVDPATEGLDEALEPARSDLGGTDGVVGVYDPLGLPDGIANPAAAPLLSQDGQGFLVVVELAPDLDDATQARTLDAVGARLAAVPGELTAVAPGASGLVGSDRLVVADITAQVAGGLAAGLLVTVPAALLVMVVLFGSLLAAAMPTAAALASVAGGLGTVLVLSVALDVDAAVVNAVVVLGVGLSLDYGILVVARFREELHGLVDDDGGAGARRRRGDGAVAAALERTMSAAGRTVAHSAAVVAAGVGALALLRPDVMRAVGAAGAAVVLVALATALTLVPALLALLGRRIVEPGRLERVPVLGALRRRAAGVRADVGLSASLVARAQRHPWWVVGACMLVLGMAAAPAARLDLRVSGVEILPTQATQRVFLAALEEGYPGASSPAVAVVTESSLEQAAAWADQIGSLDGVASVDEPTALGPYVVIGVRPAGADGGDAVAQQVVREVRALDAPFERWVVGQAATQVDLTQALRERAPLAVGLVALVAAVVVLLMTGSAVLPVTALVTSTVSVLAGLGVMVWVFQGGHLAGLLGFTSTGGVESSALALALTFGLGLSMHRTMVVVARVQEAHLQGARPSAAVRTGVQRSSRAVTAAALVLVAMLAGFVVGGTVVMKEAGVALAVSAAVDLVVVRLLLEPAATTLLGATAWWAPRPLRRLRTRVTTTVSSTLSSL